MFKRSCNIAKFYQVTYKIFMLLMLIIIFIFLVKWVKNNFSNKVARSL